MAKTDPDAERAVSRAQIVEAMSALGLDATKLYEVHISTDQIVVTEAVFDSNGHPVLNLNGDSVKKRAYILSIEEDS